jgi:hypothetical protein
MEGEPMSTLKTDTDITQQAVRRTSVIVKQIGAKSFQYDFVITLEDGSKRKLDGYRPSQQEAYDAAFDRWGKIDEHGYQEGM